MQTPPPPPPFPQGQPQHPQPFQPGQPQPIQQPQSTQQMVKTYKTGFKGTAQKKFQKEAEKLAKDGWRVQNVSSAGATVYGDPRSLTVVYVR
jgi:hypothetical protein